MKQIWPTYAYSPTTNVLTLTGLNIDRDQLLLVTAADRGRIMYNFADSAVTASAFTSGANTALTLVATTAGLTTTAALVIYFDDQATSSTVTGTVELGPTSLNALESITVTMGQVTVTGGLTDVQLRASAVTVGGTVTVGNSLTISSLPAISGTVTANPTGTQTIAGTVTANGGDFTGIVDLYAPPRAINIGFYDAQYTANFVHVNNDNIANHFPVKVGSMPDISGTVTIGSLPAISGTVTANSSNGSLTTRFGSVTTANTAFATSAVTNASRKYLLIQNVTTASNVITVGIGFTPTTTQGIQLSSGAGLTFEGSYIPTGAVNLLSSVTASCFTILEA
jgi:hypothetical protein